MTHQSAETYIIIVTNTDHISDMNLLSDARSNVISSLHLV